MFERIFDQLCVWCCCGSHVFDFLLPLREKSIRVTWQSIYCNNVVRIWSLFKVVQHVAATNVVLKIVCRRHVTRIDCFYNAIALKIVVKILKAYIANVNKTKRVLIYTFLACPCAVIPWVRVARVRKPCVRFKVRCSCWNKKRGHLHILGQPCWENDLLIFLMKF